MRRRDVLSLMATASVWPLAVHAEQKKRMLSVGAAGFSPKSLSVFAAFSHRMAELGWREGENFTFDYMQTKGPAPEDYEAGYREVIARTPDILLAPGPELGLKAALAASRNTPIVMIAVDYDPIAHGYVTSLAAPGGRVTGLHLQMLELTIKRLQLLRDVVPNSSSAIVFFDGVSADQWNAAKDAGDKLAIRLSGIDLHDPPFDYDRALAETPPENRKNLMVLTSPRFTVDRARLTNFALRNRLASMFPYRLMVEAGGLMSYGPNFDAMFAKAAEVVDRIARGAKPGDLPIEQPTHFEFVVNLSTARALGIDLSPSLLTRADEVIE